MPTPLPLKTVLLWLPLVVQLLVPGDRLGLVGALVDSRAGRDLLDHRLPGGPELLAELLPALPAALQGNIASPDTNLTFLCRQEANRRKRASRFRHWNSQQARE